MEEEEEEEERRRKGDNLWKGERKKGNGGR